jgi:hypothetical protein
MAVELSELVRQLRVQLTEAMQAAPDSEVRFELGPVELELSMAVQQDATAGAKIRFWVVEMGADALSSSQTTQHIKLTLTPQLRGRAGQPFLIAGDEVDGER